MDKTSSYILLIGILVVISIGFTIWSTITLGGSINTLNTKTDSQFKTLTSTLSSLNDSLQLESESHFISVINSVQPSIVTVLSYPVHNDTGSNNVIFLDNNGKEWNLGAGFSIDSNGDILTANHIIANTTSVIIILPDGKTIIPVSKSKNIPDLDLAILFVNSSLPSVKLQNGVSQQVGLSIAFTGYPITTSINGVNVPVETTLRGSVSAIVPFTYNNQPVPVYVLGVAANKGKGNSGGPVFSLKTGEVIGIINEKITSTEGVAISTVVSQQLINNLLSQ
jgi:S1-C subfamily serine protease